MSNENFKAACVKGLVVIGALGIAASVFVGIGMSVAPVLSIKALAVGAAYCTTAVATPLVAAAIAAGAVAWGMGIINPLCGKDCADKGGAMTTGPLFMIPAALLGGALSLPFVNLVSTACANAVASLM